MFQDISRLTKILTWLFGAYCLLVFGGLISDVLEIQLLQRMQVGDFASTEQMMAEADANDLRQQALGYMQLGLYAICAIAALFWTYNAAGNAKTLSGEPQRFSPGWSIGWYFVPILNLWRPYQVMKEIWTRSATAEGDLPDARLVWWWIMWVVGSILGQAAYRLALNAEEIEVFLLSSYATLVLDLLLIPTALIYAQIVNDICGMQIRKHEMRLEAADSLSTPMA